ncbi:MAG: helix-turn-helix domain-containing protein [Planctomycetota bacterium]
MSQSEYLTIREFAQYVGISHRTLEGWKRKGYLPPPYELTSRIHKWKRSEIDAWFSLKQRGQCDDWLELRGDLGPIKAWKQVLSRLDEEA